MLGQGAGARLKSWTNGPVWRIGRRVLIWLVPIATVLYLAALAALYHWQRDIVFVRARWWHENARPSDFAERTIGEADGTHLRIWESGPPETGKATVVFFYGNAGTLSDFAGVGEELREEGYGVVLGSYRGYSRNPGEPSEQGLFADARAILGALPRGHGPVVVWGQSLGTGVAAQMAAEGRASGLILQSPYTRSSTSRRWSIRCSPCACSPGILSTHFPWPRRSGCRCSSFTARTIGPCRSGWASD